MSVSSEKLSKQLQSKKIAEERKWQSKCHLGACWVCGTFPCENVDMHKSFNMCFCVCVCVCESCWPVEGFRRGRAEHSCWVVMSWELALCSQTDSPVYVPFQRRNHTACLNVCVCVCVCVSLSLSLSVWLRYWLVGEAGKPRGTREGLLSRAA